ncbi:MAG: SDR family oxidoreductase [Candidatus Poribacteria bacterium]|nr:SDR family oxidoreductase [Candidatus Poribacteria bacterium]
MENDKTALITGASSGIGMELARLFAQDGYRLVLTARSEDKLNALADELAEAHGAHSLILPKDLAQPNAPAELHNALKENAVQVDALINNAGIGCYGFFHETNLERIAGMLQLNIISLTALTRLLLPEMAARGGGRIMNIASTAAFQPGPLMAAYFASKAYVLSFSQAVANEAADSGVSITCLCPGPAATGFIESAQIGSPRIFKMNILDSSRVAREGYRAMTRGKRVAVVGRINKILALAVRLSPRNLTTRALRFLLTDPKRPPAKETS